MTLERKLQHLQTWNPDKRMEFFEEYHTKIELAGKDATSWTKQGKPLEEFIEKDYARFVRCARRFQYYRMLQNYNVDSLHHIAQQNKLRRYQHSCSHPAPHKIHEFP